MTVGDKEYAVAVQTLQPMGVPGISADQIVLLSKEGKILGRLRCEINSGDGTVKTRILQKRDEDGARIVVEFARGDISACHDPITGTLGTGSPSAGSRGPS